MKLIVTKSDLVGKTRAELFSSEQNALNIGATSAVTFGVGIGVWVAAVASGVGTIPAIAAAVVTIGGGVNTGIQLRNHSRIQKERYSR